MATGSDEPIEPLQLIKFNCCAEATPTALAGGKTSNELVVDVGVVDAGVDETGELGAEVVGLLAADLATSEGVGLLAVDLANSEGMVVAQASAIIASTARVATAALLIFNSTLRVPGTFPTC
jgi:hypothetical protein